MTLSITYQPSDLPVILANEKSKIPPSYFLGHTFKSLSFKDKLICIGMINSEGKLLFEPKGAISPLSDTGKERWKKLLTSQVDCYYKKTSQQDYIYGLRNFLGSHGIKTRVYHRGGNATYIACLADYLEALIHEYLAIHQYPHDLFSKEIEQFKTEDQAALPSNDIDWLDIVESDIPLTHLESLCFKFMMQNEWAPNLQRPENSPLFPLPADYILSTAGDSQIKIDRVIGRPEQLFMFTRDDLRINVTNRFEPILESTNFWQMVVDRKLKIIRTEKWHQFDFRTALAAIQLMQQGHVLFDTECSLQEILNHAWLNGGISLFSEAKKRADWHLKCPFGFLMSICFHYTHTANALNIPISVEAYSSFQKEILSSMQKASLPPLFTTLMSQFTLASLYQMALLLLFYEDATGQYRAEWNTSLTLFINNHPIIFPKGCFFKKMPHEISFFSTLISDVNKIPRTSNVNQVYDILEKEASVGLLEKVLFELAIQKKATPLSDSLTSSLVDYLSVEKEPPPYFKGLFSPWLECHFGWIRALLENYPKHAMRLWDLTKGVLTKEAYAEAVLEIYTHFGKKRPNTAYVYLEEEPCSEDLKLQLLKGFIQNPIVNPDIALKVAQNCPETPVLISVLKNLPLNTAWSFWKKMETKIHTIPSELILLLDDIVMKLKVFHEYEESFFKSSPSPERLLKFLYTFSQTITSDVSIKFFEALGEHNALDYLFKPLMVIIKENTLKARPDLAPLFLLNLRIFQKAPSLLIQEVTSALKTHQCTLIKQLTSDLQHLEFLSILALYRIKQDPKIPGAELELIENTLNIDSLEALKIFERRKMSLEALPGYFPLLMKLYKFTKEVESLIIKHITSLPFATRNDQVVASLIFLNGMKEPDLIKTAEKLSKINGVDEKRVFEALLGVNIHLLSHLPSSTILNLLSLSVVFKKELILELLNRTASLEKKDLTLLIQHMKKAQGMGYELIVACKHRLTRDHPAFVALSLTLFQNKIPYSDPLWKTIINVCLETPCLLKELIPVFTDFTLLCNMYGKKEALSKLKSWDRACKAEPISEKEKKAVDDIIHMMDLIYPFQSEDSIQAQITVLYRSMMTCKETRIENFNKLLKLLEINAVSPQFHRDTLIRLFDIAMLYPFDGKALSYFDPIERHLSVLHPPSDTSLLEWNEMRNDLFQAWIQKLELSQHEIRESHIQHAKNLKKKNRFEVLPIELNKKIQDASITFKIICVQFIEEKLSLKTFQTNLMKACRKASNIMSFQNVDSLFDDPCILCIDQFTNPWQKPEKRIRTHQAMISLLESWNSCINRPSRIIQSIHHFKFKFDIEEIFLTQYPRLLKKEIFFFELLVALGKCMCVTLQNVNLDLRHRDPVLQALDLEMIRSDRIPFLRMWDFSLYDHKEKPEIAEHSKWVKRLTDLEISRQKPDSLFKFIKRRIDILAETKESRYTTLEWNQELDNIHYLQKEALSESYCELCALYLKDKLKLELTSTPNKAKVRLNTGNAKDV